MTKTMSAQGVQSRGEDKHIKHVIAVIRLGKCNGTAMQEHQGTQGRGGARGILPVRRKSLLATGIIRSCPSVGKKASQVEGPAWASMYSENPHAAAWGCWSVRCKADNEGSGG